jgi:hypothetical protein
MTALRRPLRSRTVRRLKRVLLVLAFLAGPVAVLVSWQLRPSSGPPARPPVTSLRAVDLHRQTIYHSPQRPGYTSWVGAWTMPDKSLMTAFVQATGPVDAADRPATPRPVLAALGVSALPPGYDFWGLKLAVEYLRSRNDGRTWRVVRSDAFQAPGPYAYTPQATVALRDGTLIRRVNGDDLRYDPSIPHTAFLQRLAPGRSSWSAPQVLLDPARYTYQITRVRELADGRLIATGNVWDVPASTPPPERDNLKSRLLLLVSSDDGATWRDGLTIPPGTGFLPGNEWDTAELPDGNLVAVMRTWAAPDNRVQVRKQALLIRRGAGWVLTDVRDAPFPHSGHPELLATREGPVLHIATTGIDYTIDGRTWRPLGFTPPAEYRSGYYPRAVQTADGVVHVFAHVGADDPYGRTDQAIVMDTFRLVAERSSP